MRFLRRLAVVSIACGVSACGGDSATNVVTIATPSSVCSVSSSTRSVGVDAAAADGQLAITINRECQWTAKSDVDWIAVSPASGQGDSAIAYAVSANAAATARRGTISVNDFRVDVTQAAAPCRFSLTPTSAAVEPIGGRVAVSVTAQAGCAWTAASQASWIAIVEGASTQSGSGTLTLRVDANGAMPRTGTVTIANQVVTISQNAMTAGPVPTVPCPLTLSASSQTVPAAGGNGTVIVSGPAGCEWNAVSNASWIAITAGSPGTGPGVVQYSVAANPDPLARSGTLTIAGQEFTVGQEAAIPSPGPCAFTLSATSQSVGANGGTGQIDVTASPASCGWTAFSRDTWLTVSSGASGSGNGTMTYAAAANQTAAQRTGTLTVAGHDVTITQAAAPTQCTFSVLLTTPSIPAAGASGTITVTASAQPCAWTVTGAPGWITITAGAAGTGSGTVQFTAAANPNPAPRTATLRVAETDVTVTQAAAPAPPSCTFAVSPTSHPVPAAGATGTISVTTAATCAWTTTGAPAWVTITAGAAATGSGTVRFTVAANPNPAQRIARFTVAETEVTMTQAAAPPPCTFTLSPQSQSVPAIGASGQFTVAASAGSCAWTVTGAPAWVTVTSGATGTGNGTVRFTVASNLNLAQRMAQLKVGDEEFTITQAAALTLCTFTVAPESQSVGGGAGTGQIGVTASAPACAWTASVTSGAPWLTITSGASDTGNGMTKYAVTANTTGLARNGTLTVAGHVIRIDQAAQLISVNGKVSDKTGTCPNLAFNLPGRTIRTNAATSFSVDCTKLKDKDNVSVTGLVQPDNSVLALTLRQD